MFVLYISASILTSAWCRPSVNDWKSIQRDVKIRLFAPETFKRPALGVGQCGIWEQGKDIMCDIGEDEDVQIKIPSWDSGVTFNPNMPVKGFIHGLGDDAVFRSEAVTEYQQKFGGKVNVILVDWSPLSKSRQIGSRESIYFSAARNIPLVGEYLGRCLAAISRQTGLKGQNIHLAGHGLGGQMLGSVGPVYLHWTGERLGRLTGLDPAGPGFVEGGDTYVDPILARARLHPSNAVLVDVIHTNADVNGPVLLTKDDPAKLRLGDYGPNGHMDFYPDGGDIQHGCDPRRNVVPLCKVGCSHDRAYHYFIDSINEGCILPVMKVNTVEACMGDGADRWYRPTKIQTHLDVDTHYWNGNYRTEIGTDCEVTKRFACNALREVFPEFVDGFECNGEHSPNSVCN